MCVSYRESGHNHFQKSIIRIKKKVYDGEKNLIPIFASTINLKVERALQWYTHYLQTPHEARDCHIGTTLDDR